MRPEGQAPRCVGRPVVAAPLERRLTVAEQWGDEVSRILPTLRIDELVSLTVATCITQGSMLVWNGI